MAALALDIETIGEDFDTLDVETQSMLTRWIKKESQSEEEYNVALEELKDGLGFSPLTGEIVAVGVLDCERNKGAVYYQAPGEDIEDFEENNITFRALSEADMLEAFWEGVRSYNEVVSFNGRSFDVPFINIRSAIHEVRPSKDLMSNRYLGSQRNYAKHIDLLDQLTYYGAVRKKGNLHLWCRAFGIESPKVEGVDGDNVAELFAEKKYLDIARYNVRDIQATKELFEKWRTYLDFSR